MGHTGGIPTDATADFYLGIIHGRRAKSRRSRFVRPGKWLTGVPILLLGADISGATLEIVGFGTISRSLQGSPFPHCVNPGRCKF